MGTVDKSLRSRAYAAEIDVNVKIMIARPPGVQWLAKEALGC
jgi:hypothetical protein